MDLSDSLLALVRTEARRIGRTIPAGVLSVDDLEGHGRLGLIEARDRFDPQRGVPFDLYARRRIRGSIFDALRLHGVLRRRGWETVRRQAVAHEVLDVMAASEPPGDDAGFLQSTVGALAAAFLTDAAMHLQSDRTEAADDTLAEAQLHARLRLAVGAMATEDREVVEAVYDFDDQGDTGAALARRRGVTRSHVSRTHLRILDELRQTLTEAPS